MSEAKIIGGEFRISSNAMAGDCKNKIEAVYSLGRTCLYAIFEGMNSDVREVLLPDYICYSVAEVLCRLNISFKHYHIMASFVPDLESIKDEIIKSKGQKCLVLVNYFGFVDLDETIIAIRTEFPEVTIIVDDVQNFYGFGCHVDYDYCFSSFRKWFAVPEGAAIINKEGNLQPHLFLKDADYISYKLAGNLLKNHSEITGDFVALELIEKGERMMDQEYLYRCADISNDLLHRIDVDFVKQKRKINAAYLHERLQRLEICHLYDPDVTPLFIPIVVSGKIRNKIRDRLFAERIYTPVHWPVRDQTKQGNNELYQTELSLICDQRYDEEDMERMLRGLEDEI